MSILLKSNTEAGSLSGMCRPLGYPVVCSRACGKEVMLFPTSAAASGPQDASQPGDVMKIDDRPDPLSTQQRTMRKQVLQEMIAGASTGQAWGHTHAVANGQYVELVREGEDPIWTVLGEFSDFFHNSIAEPDRNYDNTTI